jgi:antitoxin (DNA-binding transcriptional repressor) of toxin-antitoxin stability system
MKAKNIIGLKEFRENVVAYANKAEKGESFIVCRRSRPLFRISSVEDEDDEKGWKKFIDFTKYRKGGIPAQELLEIMKSMR